MSNRIFISYRREESKYQARMIFQAFSKLRPTNEVFMDVDSIPLGVDFAGVIRGWVQKCDVLLALVGSGWSESKDPRSGLRRLDNPNDFVRIEISEALTRGIPVVPVLLDDAPLPDRDALPDDLRSLFDRNAAYVSFRTFDADVESLIKRLKKGITEVGPPLGPGPNSLAQSPSPTNAPAIASSSAAAIASSSAAKEQHNNVDHAPGNRRKVLLFVAIIALLVGAAFFSALWLFKDGPVKGSIPAQSELLSKGAREPPPVEKKEPPVPKVQNGQNCVEIPVMDMSQNPPKKSIITRCN